MPSSLPLPSLSDNADDDSETESGARPLDIAVLKGYMQKRMAMQSAGSRRDMTSTWRNGKPRKHADDSSTSRNSSGRR